MAMEGVKLKALDDKPEIHGEEWIYDAWCEMAGDRAGSMGPVPTPWTAIDRYAKRYGIEGDTFEVFVHCLRSLDTGLIEYHEDKQKKQDKVEKKDDDSS